LQKRLDGRQSEFESLRNTAALSDAAAMSLAERIAALARVNRYEKDLLDNKLNEVRFLCCLSLDPVCVLVRFAL